MPQCTAKSVRSQEQCKKPAIRGGTVCGTHGGSSPQVKRKAAERLAQLQDPAVDALARSLNATQRTVTRQGKIVEVGPDHNAQTRAASAVLDRTGLGPSSQTEVQVHASVHLHSLIEQLDRQPEIIELPNEAQP